MAKTLWRHKEPTEGKHLLLRSYLDGWFPILGSFNGRLLFVDGFAGPGEYDDGEPGSPLVALECVRRHKQDARLRGVEVLFLFIEGRKGRADHLETVLARQEPVPGTDVTVVHGEFDENMTGLLDQLDRQQRVLAPAFVMVDPFGVKGSRMALIERILANPRSECLISFMYEPIRRFHRTKEYKKHLNELFGTKKWKKCFKIKNEPERKRFLHDLFTRQLKKHGAKYVVTFELYKGARHIYTLYFTTSSLKGCDLMKSCIWKLDPGGSFSFRAHALQFFTLFGADTDQLARQLRDEFGNQWAPIEQIEQFVMSDATPFHSGQLRRDTLQRLEREGKIDVQRPPGRKSFAPGRGIRVRFK